MIAAFLVPVEWVTKTPSASEDRMWDEADGSERDSGWRRLSERQSKSAARSRHQVQRRILRDSALGRNPTHRAASKKSESKFSFGAVESIREGRVSVEADTIRRGVAPSCPLALRPALSRGEEPPR